MENIRKNIVHYFLLLLIGLSTTFSSGVFSPNFDQLSLFNEDPIEADFEDIEDNESAEEGESDDNDSDDDALIGASGNSGFESSALTALTSVKLPTPPFHLEKRYILFQQLKLHLV